MKNREHAKQDGPPHFVERAFGRLHEKSLVKSDLKAIHQLRAQCHLLDEIRRRLDLPNDAALACLLKVSPPAISKIRNGKNMWSAPLLACAHQVTGIDISELRLLAGMTKSRFGKPPSPPARKDKGGGVISHRIRQNSASVRYPHRVVDTIIQRFSLRSDRELARMLGITSATISKLRHGVTKVTPALVIRMHETTGMDFDELSALAEEANLAHQDGVQHSSEACPKMRGTCIGRRNNQPHRLIDTLRQQFGLMSDLALAQAIGVSHVAISKVRHGRPISSTMILRIHDAFGIDIDELRSLIREGENFTPLLSSCPDNRFFAR